MTLSNLRSRWAALAVFATLACVSVNPAYDEPSAGESGDEGEGDGDPSGSAESSSASGGEGDGDGDGQPGDGEPGDGDDPGDGDGEPADCPPGLTLCEGQCVDTNIEPKHCGECNSPCEAEGEPQCFEGACVAADRVVFRTSLAYSGNLGGLAGADLACLDRAKAAAMEGDFKAWLSTAALGPADRMTHSSGPYVTPDGVLVATSWADLTDGALLHPIDRNEFGDPMAEGQFICEGEEVWTNTKPDGTPRWAADCGAWGDGNFNGMGSSSGRWTRSDASWTQTNCEPIVCSSLLPLYCVQQ